MTDLAPIQETCGRLAARLQGRPRESELRATYMEMATLTGLLHGAVGDARRVQGETDAVRAAEASLDRFKAGMRQVGLDIRLASEAATQIGLQTALDTAIETLEALETSP
jgi:hypothetical protein